MEGLDGEKKDILKEQKTLALQKIQEALVGFSSTAKKEIFDELVIKTSAEIEAEKEAKEVEKEAKHEELQPTGFDDAPKSAQRKRKKLVDEENKEKLQWIHDNVSYNADHTMNIIKLNKTFCEDVSGTGQRCNWEEAKVLAKSKGYELPSDYNNKDSQKIRENSDWYKVINIFSGGKGDTVEGMELFRDMAGCNDRYWTSTQYTDNDILGIAIVRGLNENNCCKDWDDEGYDENCVCGFKKMNISA